MGGIMKIKAVIRNHSKSHPLCFLICMALLFSGCAAPSQDNTVHLIYENADTELLSMCEIYGITADDMAITSIHYGSFVSSESEALAVMEVTNPDISEEMAGMGDTLKVFAILDKDLSRLKSSVFSVVADSLDYSILGFPLRDTELLFINAIDIAAGPEEFTGGLYSAAAWENMFPAELCNDPDFLPLLMGDRLYLGSVSEANMEQRIFFNFDPESDSLKLYDPEQGKYL